MQNLTAAVLTAEVKAYNDRAEKGRVATGLANVRASFVVLIATEDGYMAEDGTLVHMSENDAWKAFGITRSVGQRNLKAARVMLALGYTLDTFPTQGKVAASVADLSARANRQGVKRVEDHQWTEAETVIRAEGMTEVSEAVALLDEAVAEVEDDRKAEAAEKREAAKVEKAEAATIAGRLASIMSAVESVRTMARHTPLSDDERMMLEVIASVAHEASTIEAEAEVEVEVEDAA